MTTKEVLAEMAAGAVLCMEHGLSGDNWWLEPRKIHVWERVAARVIAVEGVKMSGDGLFADEPSQTWRL